MVDGYDQQDHPVTERMEEPLDAANQSLADALRASFGILKGIMAVLVVLYLFSNVRTLESHEQALCLRLGRLLPEVHDPGLVWGLPFPVDEIIPLPTNKSNDLMIDSHTFFRRASEIGKPLSFIDRSSQQGLDPVLDGALLTADAGLVHARWKVTYKIDDVQSYVSNIAGQEVEAAEHLIKTFVEHAGVHVASELTAEQILRTRVNEVQRHLRRRVNAQLSAIGSGVTVKLIEMVEPTPPLQIRDAFDRTQRAENSKQKRIRDAQQQRTRMLSEAAGSAYPRLLKQLRAVEVASAAGKPVDRLQAEVDRMLMDDVEGEAGTLINDAGAYLSVVVGRMQGDVERYRTLVPEWERNPHVLISRLWEQTKQEIFQSPGVLKVYRPAGTKIRLHIDRDPEQSRLEEERRLQQQGFDPSKLRKKRLIPVGPDAA